jgi:hypothetical protein
MLVVAATTHLPPRVLPVIQALEGGAPGVVRPDENGTADFGVMQVNSIWLPSLSARSGLTEAAVRQRLIYDPCFNIAAAALILRTYLAETHGNFLQAIGDYHSHTAPLNAAYVAQAEAMAARMFGGAAP